MSFGSLAPFVRAPVVLLGMTMALAEPVAAQDAEPADRIVAVGGAITEIVYALGEEDRLVARDSTSLYPEAALDLPDIGYMRALSPEGVLSVEPDLIIALEGSGPPEALDVLQRASVEMVMLPEGFDAEGIVEKIETVGALVNAQEKAAALARDVASEIAAAQAAAAEMGEKRRVLFILSMSGGRIMASGTGTAANAIITLAGGENVISEYEGYRQLTDEAVIEAAPDIILMMDRQGEHDAADDELFTHPAIVPTPAGQARRSVRMDGPLLLGFGPRTGIAVRELAAALHGDGAD